MARFLPPRACILSHRPAPTDAQLSQKCASVEVLPGLSPPLTEQASEASHGPVSSLAGSGLVPSCSSPKSAVSHCPKCLYLWLGIPK